MPRKKPVLARRWLIYYGALVLTVLVAMAIALLVEPGTVKGVIGVGVVVGGTLGIVGSAIGVAWKEVMSEHGGDRRNVGGGFHDCNAEPTIDLTCL
ncbi:hypothetical protein ODJ79_27600 [Actinoplanes sp. KI2]|uniref:hypothetical protein n=1 Tax=Actinoplanes sp. KI2 TaxID=2983315 RepID=UPI0021D5D459|nr:hypothetical protein [Actinoplanes sp. KI2]MCU7727500.1 hypothetical protein [Actinoplanes sp. KI2]